MPKKISTKNKTKSSYNKVLGKRNSWQPLAVLAMAIFGGSVALSVFAANPSSVSSPNPTPDCIYNKDAQSYNCSSPTPTSNASSSTLTPNPVKAMSALPEPDMSKLVLDTDAEKIQMFSINAERGKIGLATLVRDSCLDRAARFWALSMANKNLYDPNPNNALVHSDIASLINKECGGSSAWSAAAENIGYTGYSTLANPSQVVFDGFMGSEKHRNDILDNRWQMVGIGAYRNTVTNVLWVDQMFMKCKTTCNYTTTISSYN